MADLFEQDCDIHLYGLADLDEPFWSESTWYLRGQAAVGVVGLGDGWTAGYAMSRSSVEETLALLDEVLPSMQAGTWVTGPLGLADRVETSRPIDRKGPHRRMVIGPDISFNDDRAVTLNATHVQAIEELHRCDPASSFFLPSMMRTGTFVGVWDADVLVASAGTHTASKRHGVAAIGAVIVRPEHRGRGLGHAVTASLVMQLRANHRTIGLNVAESNASAIRLYERMGFKSVAEYEEIELLA